MTKTEILEEVTDSFLPHTLAISSTNAMNSIYKDGIRKINRIAPIHKYETFAYSGSRIQLPEYVINVVDVVPTVIAESGYKRYQLMFFPDVLFDSSYNLATYLDQLSYDRTERRVLYGNINWKFERPYLYVADLDYDSCSSGTSASVTVRYLHKLSESDDIDESNPRLEWLISYCRALVKRYEGEFIRKGAIIDTAVDGTDMATEGATEAKELIEDLRTRIGYTLIARRT